MSVRCETRSDLEGYGMALLILGGVMFFCTLGAAGAIRDNDWSDLDEFGLLAFLFLDYVVLLAWVGLRIREWKLLGDAIVHLTPTRPWVGVPFNGRMQFARPPAVPGTATAELICQVSTSSGTGSKKNTKTKTLWREKQVLPSNALLQFTFSPPEGLPAAGTSGSTEVNWWLRVRSPGLLGGFRRRFRMPMGRKESVQPAEQILFDAKFAASDANLESQPGRAFKTVYTLAGIALLANVGALAWAYADRLPGTSSAAQDFEGKLRLGDLRQTTMSDFAAQLDGAFSWKRGSLDVRAESLRMRAWDCEGACPKIEQVSLVLWQFGEDEQGGIGGTGVARSEPLTVDKVPQPGAVIDLGAQSFALRIPKSPDPRITTLILEVKTEKREHEYGSRFGGSSRLFGLVQAPGEAATCAKVKGARDALEHFCHVRFSESMSEISAAERQRLLFLAVGRGNLDAVKALLAAEVKVDAVNSFGYTPLMVAAWADQADIVAALIDAGGNPNFAAKPDSEYGSDSPLGAALTAGAMRSAQVLIDKGADLNGMHGRSPMVHVAVSAGLPEAIALLVKKGADVNARAGWGSQPTPLMAAAGIGNLEIVNKLLEAGADPAAGDASGNTARDYAATHNRRDVLERLKSHGGK
jgi:ankyrin repeat protein